MSPISPDHPWRTPAVSPAEPARALGDAHGDKPRPPRADLERLRALLGYALAALEEGAEDGSFRVSKEAATEFVDLIGGAVAEILYLRTVFRPGYVGHDGPRFSMVELEERG